MLRLAAKVAKKVTTSRFMHAAIVQRGGAIVATGYNHGETHAEVMALSKLWPSERVNTKVWSIRITRGGKFAMAKPCPECQAFLRSNGVKIVWYSNSSGAIERMKL